MCNLCVMRRSIWRKCRQYHLTYERTCQRLNFSLRNMNTFPRITSSNLVKKLSVTDSIFFFFLSLVAIRHYVILVDYTNFIYSMCRGYQRKFQGIFWHTKAASSRTHIGYHIGYYLCCWLHRSYDGVIIFLRIIKFERDINVAIGNLTNKL